MRTRYDLPTRVRVEGDEDRARGYMPRARVLLARLVAGLAQQNGEYASQTIVEGDVTYRVQFAGGMGEVVISVPLPGVVAADLDDFNIWIPRGFVVVPASNAAPHGWGLPVAGSPDDPSAPPVDTAFWTVKGALPQVLLSKDVQAAYPKTSQIPIPMYYDDAERTKDFKFITTQVGWRAYRPNFADVTSFSLDLITELNTRRPSQNPLTTIFRGFSDLAQWFGRLADKYGLNPTNYPDGSNTFDKRVAKDGTAREVATASPIGSIGIVDTSGDTSVSDYADSMIAAIPELATDTLFKIGTMIAFAGGGAQTVVAVIDQTDQWVRAGNIDWQSNHDEIPAISWTGPRGRAVPSYEMSSGVFPHSLTGGTTLTFASYLPDLAMRVIDGVEEREFDRFVFCRGRILAQLPNSGYVLGAAIQKLPALLTTQQPIYRLVVIAWHRADQKYIENINAGLIPITVGPGWFDTTSDVRIWYADMPIRNGLACAPDRIIDGAYNEFTNPSGWQEIHRYRLGSVSNTPHFPGNFRDAAHDPSHTLTAGAQGYTDASIQVPMVYWHPWFFNASGTEAQCMRGDAWGGIQFDNTQYWTSPMWPSQQLKISLPIDRTAPPTSALSSVWENPLQFFGPGDSSADRNFAVDYAGDVARTLLLVNTAQSPYGRIVVTGPNGVLYDFSSIGAGGTAAVLAQMSFLDARFDNYVVAEHHFHEPADGNSFTILQTYINRVQAASSTTPAHPNTTYWFGINAFNLTAPDTPSLNQAWFGVFTNPVYASNFVAGFQLSDATISQHKNDYVGSARYGSIGTAPNWSITLTTWNVASSMDADTLYKVSGGWLNFTGVL